MMWTRKELKEQAKEALQRNYWKIVLVAMLLFCLGGGVGTVGIGGGNNNNNSNRDEEEVSQDVDSMEDTAYDEIDGRSDEERFGKKHSFIRIDTSSDKIEGVMEENKVVVRIVAAVIFSMIFTVVVIAIFLVDIFLLNPFSVGVDRFMLKSVDDRAQVREIAYGFDHCYKNIVKTMFHRDLQIFLWALLFIIPGFYKKYQYRMVTYIMAEHPDMDYRSALQMSRDMMEGHKWRAFVLDLSFILWHFLGTITCGIAEIFYVQPYQQLTCAALYRRLCRPDGTEEENAAVYERAEGRY